jgi:hypothetical protein
LKPEVYVVNARDRFDADGHLTDDTVRERIRMLLDALREWIYRVRSRLDR